MEIVRLGGHLWGIQSPRYSPALHAVAKETPGMVWDATSRAWRGYPDAVRLCARRLLKKGIEVTGELPTRGCLKRTRVWSFGKNSSNSLLNGLREYQKEGVEFITSLAHTGVLLADDLGLGKTSQAIRAIGALRKDAIVVCPSFVRGVWTREIAKWLPKTNVIELDGVTLRCTHCKGAGCIECVNTGKIQILPKETRQTVYMVHYDIVYAWERLLRKSGAQTIVFDEIHYLQSDKSRRSVSCRNLAIPMKYRIGLSGTPMTNRPSDLWNPLNTLCPWRFGKPFDFYIRYSDAHQETITMRDGPKTIWNTTGASHMKELNRRLRWFMLRRTKTDVKMELPPRIRQNIELEVPRSFTGYSKGLKADKAIRAALALAADGKLPKAIELVASHVTDKRKIVVFSHRVAVAKMIAAALQKQKIDARPATGEETRKQRQRLIDEKHDVLCATMDAMPVGVDLSYADVIVFVELDYVPSKILQCEGRVFRFGQKKSVLVQYVIALGTLDECIRDQVLAKLENFEKIIGNVDDNLQGDLGGEVLDTKAQLKSLTSKIMKQAEELELKRKEARRKKAA
jgi:SWI/SNF-related matrix-associated actin-dependent regulator 1 of chromatin subfamily A